MNQNSPPSTRATSMRNKFTSAKMRHERSAEPGAFVLVVVAIIVRSKGSTNALQAKGRACAFGFVFASGSDYSRIRVLVPSTPAEKYRG